jgi:fatty-acyl-CoA synthase
LRGASLVPGDVVAYLCLGSASHIVSWFGTFAGGYVAANLHTRNSSVAEIAEALRWLGAKFIVHDVEFTSAVEAAVRETGLPIRTLGLDDDAESWETLSTPPRRSTTHASAPTLKHPQQSSCHRAAPASPRA